MRVALYGATGMIGSRILTELVSRGHQVTAVARHPEKLAGQKIAVKLGDVLDPESVAATARGSDAAISAYGPPPDDTKKMVDSVRSLVKGLTASGVGRFLMVGGAGSLEAAPGTQVVDLPGFPEPYRAIALAHRDALQVLKTSALDWTSFSPAAVIEPGARTGKFRLDTDKLVADEKGESKISAEDYAVALVDELENPRHVKQRFTIGY